MIRTVATIAMFTLMTGCAHYTLVEPQRVVVANAYSVETPIAWNKFRQGHAEGWTVDGPRLQAIYFYRAIDDGDPVFQVRGDRAKNMPTFDSAMTPLEVKDLVEAALGVLGFQQVETSYFRPEKFGDLAGYRFDLGYVRQSGLEMRGAVLGAQKDNKLFLIIYTGARLYYFDKYKDDVEHIFGSIQIR